MKLRKKVKGKIYFTKYYKESKKRIGLSTTTTMPLVTDDETELRELQNKIKEINIVLLDFQFKKATRQPIKPHEVKIAKKERARLITQYWKIYRESILYT